MLVENTHEISNSLNLSKVFVGLNVADYPKMGNKSNDVLLKQEGRRLRLVEWVLV
jgi:hypothetical protein